MNIDKFEVWVRDHILKNDKIRKVAYGAYQRSIWLVSKKIKSEGDITKLTPDDGYEYLFGYYDKCPWDDTGRYILALRVKTTIAVADSKEKAELVIIDLTDIKKIKVIATTTSWNVQQGCMAQWMDDSHVLYNDFRDGRNCSVILNLKDETERIIDRAVYTLSTDKKTALSLDFSRLHRLRPGYGYANIPDSTENEKCPDKTCIWKIDIDSGDVMPLLKYIDFANFEPRPEMMDAEHKVNHMMISPSGKRFMVLHRWFKNGEKFTRLVTCNIDGTDMYNLSDDNFVSHCCWKNEQEILSYLNKKDGGKGYYLMKDKTKEYEQLWPSLVMDGHPTYSYDGKYVVTDTYPNRKRIQSIYVMNGDTVDRVARVFSPFKYGGNVRCDLHPRWSKNGNQICFDGAFDGNRGIYSVDISKMIVPDISYKEDMASVTVVMASYNGEKYIKEQIESLRKQKNVKLNILVRDDGSTDRTKEILDDYQNRGVLQWYSGEHLNVQKGFLDLLKHSPDSDYYAFCDQDDVWDDDKLYCAVSRLKSLPENKPSLYYSGLRLVDSDLRYLSCHYISDDRDLHANYFISNIAGCTTVFNKQLRDTVNKGEPRFILMHDSWVYKICLAVGGNVVADRYPHINYRQHATNTVGMKNGIRNRLDNINKYIYKFKIQEQLKNLRMCYEDIMTEEYLELTNLICDYDQSVSNWVKLLKYNRFSFKNKGLNVLVKLKILLRKV